MTKLLLVAICAIFLYNTGHAQACTPLGDQATYGTGNVWIGYLYNNENFTAYAGYVTQGTASDPSFDQNFGGSDVTYATNGCGVATSTFSARYKLNKTFAPANYTFVVGADDGYRLSVDGGVTWVIDRWLPQSYNTTTAVVYLNGPTNLVLEYYEAGGDNRVSFTISNSCTGVEDPSVYGTGNTWNAYYYDGTNFNQYAGKLNKGSAGDPGFNENFGGSTATFTTSGCDVYAETFSARYRLRKTFLARLVTFTVGGDDGYRLSLDGGATWVINGWSEHSWSSQSYTALLVGTFDMVIEYYENGGENSVGFVMSEAIVLPVKLVSFNGSQAVDGVKLDWKVITDEQTLNLEPQRSSDGANFRSLASIDAPLSGSGGNWTSSYTDRSGLSARTWYRLKMITGSGEISYSPVFIVSGKDAQAKGMTIFPSVIGAGQSFSLLVNEQVAHPQLSISDMTGRTVIRSLPGMLSAGIPVKLNTDGLRSGMYLVSVINDSGLLQTQRLVIR